MYFCPDLTTGFFSSYVYYCSVLSHKKKKNAGCFVILGSLEALLTVVLGLELQNMCWRKKNTQLVDTHCWVCMISYHFFPLAFPMKPMHRWGGRTVVCDETQQTPRSVFELAALPPLASWHIYLYFWFGKTRELIERQPRHDTALDLQTLHVHVCPPVVSI